MKLHSRPAATLSQALANYSIGSTTPRDVRPAGRDNPSPTLRARLPSFPRETAAYARQTPPNPHRNDSRIGWAVTRKHRAPPDDAARRSPAVQAGTKNFPPRARTKL